MLALAAIAASLAGTSPCLRDGQSIEGEFRWLETRHVGNGQYLRYPFVVVDEPVCVDDPREGRKWGSWVQVALPDPSAARRVPLGDRVRVSGAWSIPFTAWHIGDLIVFGASPPTKAVLKET